MKMRLLAMSMGFIVAMASMMAQADVTLTYKEKYGDHMGVSSACQAKDYYFYDAQGRVVRHVFHTAGTSGIFEVQNVYYHNFDDKGNLTSVVNYQWRPAYSDWSLSDSIAYEYDDKGYCIVEVGGRDTYKYTYDENGNIISEHVLTNDGEYTNLYSYDEMNRVIQKTYTKSSSQYYITDYEYDEMGNLIKKTSTGYSNKDSIGHPNEDKITLYTLDDVGLVVSSTTVQKYYVFDWEKTTNTTYIYDENGRLIQEHTTCGDFIDSNGEIAEKSKYASYIVDYSYGDYIIGSES